MLVRILGAGIIGLACSDELRRRGHEVILVDRTPASGASWAAAGMLSPGGEAWHGETALLELGLRSRARWDGFAARLGVSLSSTGTLLVGVDHGDLQQVHRRAELLARHGLPVEVVGADELRRLEPTLVARAAGGALLPDDHSVNPRAVLAALLDRNPVIDRATTAYDVTVLATGARLPAPYSSLVRGVRGEIVRVRSDDPPTRTLHAEVRGEPVYVVPRPRGEVVIGATCEEHDQPPHPTVGGVWRLLAAARELVPGLDRADLIETIARDRPGTPDNLPLVGPSGQDGVVLAAGHFRHGVLLAPLTAALVADHLEHGRVEPAVDPRRLIRSSE